LALEEEARRREAPNPNPNPNPNAPTLHWRSKRHAWLLNASVSGR
jgi:hypothetical protein